MNRNLTQTKPKWINLIMPNSLSTTNLLRTSTSFKQEVHINQNWSWLSSCAIVTTTMLVLLHTNQLATWSIKCSQTCYVWEALRRFSNQSFLALHCFLCMPFLLFFLRTPLKCPDLKRKVKEESVIIVLVCSHKYEKAETERLKLRVSQNVTALSQQFDPSPTHFEGMLMEFWL